MANSKYWHRLGSKQRGTDYACKFAFTSELSP